MFLLYGGVVGFSLSLQTNGVSALCFLLFCFYYHFHFFFEGTYFRFWLLLLLLLRLCERELVLHGEQCWSVCCVEYDILIDACNPEHVPCERLLHFTSHELIQEFYSESLSSTSILCCLSFPLLLLDYREIHLEQTYVLVVALLNKNAGMRREQATRPILLSYVLQHTTRQTHSVIRWSPYEKEEGDDDLWLARTI